MSAESAAAEHRIAAVRCRCGMDVRVLFRNSFLQPFKGKLSPALNFMAQQEDPTDQFYRQIWPQAPALLRVALQLTGQQSDAEDLVQEALIKAFRSMDSLRNRADPRAWLFTILRRTWIDRGRAVERRSEEIQPNEVLATAPAPDDAADQQQRRTPAEILEEFSDQEIIAALKTVPEETRWALLLVDVQQFDQTYAAEILDVPLGTVKSRLHRGRMLVRDALLAAHKTFVNRS